MGVSTQKTEGQTRHVSKGDVVGSISIYQATLPGLGIVPGIGPAPASGQWRRLQISSSTACLTVAGLHSIDNSIICVRGKMLFLRTGNQFIPR